MNGLASKIQKILKISLSCKVSEYAGLFHYWLRIIFFLELLLNFTYFGKFLTTISSFITKKRSC